MGLAGLDPPYSLLRYIFGGARCSTHPTPHSIYRLKTIVFSTLLSCPRWKATGIVRSMIRQRRRGDRVLERFGRLMPRLACFDSPGPFTTQLITASFSSSTPGYFLRHSGIEVRR